jgi:hypothetical protein
MPVATSGVINVINGQMGAATVALWGQAVKHVQGQHVQGQPRMSQRKGTLPNVPFGPRRDPRRF